MGLIDKSYEELKNITDARYAGNTERYFEKVITLLEKYGIKPRQKDGELLETNISIPKSVKNAIVVGLRYGKKDGSNAEDLFLFQQNHPVVPYYKGSLENKLKEYLGTHHHQKYKKK